jgi:hypothetical protein
MRMALEDFRLEQDFADYSGVSWSPGRGMSVDEMTDALSKFDPYGETTSKTWNFSLDL